MKYKNNIKKLAVGIETINDLKMLQAHHHETLGYCCAYTTFKPQRFEELIEKGSLYWIIKGRILARQKILGFESYIGDGNRKRTIIILDKDVIETQRHAHRPFQGWRYLADSDIPQDIDTQAYKEIPEEVLSEMQDLGLL